MALEQEQRKGSRYKKNRACQPELLPPRKQFKVGRFGSVSNQEDSIQFRLRIRKRFGCRYFGKKLFSHFSRYFFLQPQLSFVHRPMMIPLKNRLENR